MMKGLYSFVISLFLIKAVHSYNASRLKKIAQRLQMNAAKEEPIKNYVLFYDYVPDILEKRAPHRPAHLELWDGLVKKGVVVAGGAFSPPSGAMFCVKAISKEFVENIVKQDPYLAAGLVTKYDIREWNVVLGAI